MRSLIKTVALIVLLIAVTTLIFMSIASLRMSATAKTLNEAVNTSKSIAEIFAEADSEKEFIAISEKEWSIESYDKRLKMIKDDFEVIVITEAESKGEGTMVKMAILVFREGERIYELDTLKYFKGEVSYYE